jgi:predicted DNA-binding protein (MmcQ/YjbR family)
MRHLNKVFQKVKEKKGEVGLFPVFFATALILLTAAFILFAYMYSTASLVQIRMSDEAKIIANKCYEENFSSLRQGKSSAYHLDNSDNWAEDLDTSAYVNKLNTFLEQSLDLSSDGNGTLIKSGAAGTYAYKISDISISFSNPSIASATLSNVNSTPADNLIVTITYTLELPIKIAGQPVTLLSLPQGAVYVYTPEV